MKQLRKTSTFLLLALLAMPAGCDDTLNLEGMTEQQIQALFVGEWKEIGRGNSMYPELDPSGDTLVFRNDGTVGGTLPGGSAYFNPEDTLSTYRVDAEFLHIDGGRELYEHTFRHDFSSRNKFRLDHAKGFTHLSGFTPYFLIYKRIK